MVNLNVGPTKEPLFFKEIKKDIYSHREENFYNLFNSVKTRLLKLLDMKEVFFFPTNGTGGMEALASNFTKSKFLVVSNGGFAKRFTKILSAKSIEYKELEFDGEIDTNKVLDNLDDIDIVYMVALDSKKGIRNNYEEIFQKIKIKNKKIITAIDAISVAGNEPFDSTNSDIIIVVAQKGFSSGVGLSMLVLSEYADEFVEENKTTPDSYFFDFRGNKKQEIKFTLPIEIFQRLDMVLDRILEKDFFDRRKKIVNSFKDALKYIGIEILHESKKNLSLTLIRKGNINLKKELEKENIFVAKGLEDNVARVAHMAFIDELDLAMCLDSLEKILDRYNIRKYDGNSIKRFKGNI